LKIPAAFDDPPFDVVGVAVRQKRGLGELMAS
jgi:hypothetical protein